MAQLVHLILWHIHVAYMRPTESFFSHMRPTTLFFSHVRPT
jgi:hypothetical protein